jgi:hypothetical protein
MKSSQKVTPIIGLLCFVSIFFPNVVKASSGIQPISEAIKSGRVFLELEVQDVKSNQLHRTYHDGTKRLVSTESAMTCKVVKNYGERGPKAGETITVHTEHRDPQPYDFDGKMRIEKAWMSPSSFTAGKKGDKFFAVFGAHAYFKEPIRPLACRAISERKQWEAAHAKRSSSNLGEVFDDMTPARWNTPIVFAKAGDKSTLTLPDMSSMAFSSVDLVANNQPVIRNVPVKRKNMQMKITATFPYFHYKRGNIYRVVVGGVPSARSGALGEIVTIHHTRNLVWKKMNEESKKEVTLYCLEAPLWFRQWADACRLPITVLSQKDDVKKRMDQAVKKGQTPLLILGNNSAGASVETLWQKYKEIQCNILVLRARWIQGVDGHRKHWWIKPRTLAAGGTIMPSHDGRPHHLKYTTFGAVGMGKLNRWPIVRACNEDYAIEMFGQFDTMPIITASGIPWYEQLGRKCGGDGDLLEIIRKAALARPQVGTRRIVNMAWPLKMKKAGLAGDNLPYSIVQQAPDKKTGSNPARVYILDTRLIDYARFYNSQQLPEIKKQIFSLPERIASKDIIFIVGDSPLLYKWKWLGADKNTKTTPQNQVIWIPHTDQQERIDQRIERALTKLGVKITPPKPK